MAARVCAFGTLSHAHDVGHGQAELRQHFAGFILQLPVDACAHKSGRCHIGFSRLVVAQLSNGVQGQVERNRRLGRAFEGDGGLLFFRRGEADTLGTDGRVRQA